MRICLTGVTSFTGFWFAKKITAAGHEIIAPLRSRCADYSDLKRARLDQLRDSIETHDDAPFGSDKFLDLIGGEKFDVICHHAAETDDYKSDRFQLHRAVESNTFKMPEVLETFQNQDGKGLMVTGSVFENDVGTGSRDSDAFSPYGLSKSISWQIARYHARRIGLPIGRFVIPNPFGPYEEKRFCDYLIRTWKAGKVASVNTPNYVRDNIHVSLMALAYVDEVEALVTAGTDRYLEPSGYVEEQGVFAERFARAMRPRLGLAAELDLAHQTSFPEPRRRINRDCVIVDESRWNEQAAWDELADYYSPDPNP